MEVPNLLFSYYLSLLKVYVCNHLISAYVILERQSHICFFLPYYLQGLVKHLAHSRIQAKIFLVNEQASTLF